MKKLRTYLPFAKAAIHQQLLAYPFESFMYFFGTTISVFVMYYIWKIIYAGNPTQMIEGFTFREMVAYIMLSYGVVQSTDSGTVWIIGDDIRTGNIIMNLIKPINYHLRVFSDVTGVSLCVALGLLGPVSIIIHFVFGIGTFGGFILFLLSLFMGYVIAFLFDFLFGMLTFYVKNLWGIGFGKSALVRLLSGALIPLAFFPDAFRIALDFLPFKGIVYIPIMLFLGKFTASEIMFNLAVQAVWIIILLWLNNKMWHKAVTRLTVQGG